MNLRPAAEQPGRSLGLVLVALLALIAWPITFASAATNAVDVYPADFQHKIGDNIAGADVVYAWESDSVWSNNAIRSNLVDLGAAFIRYPGGEVTDYYHWQNPNGSGWSDTWSPSWNPTNTLNGTNWMSLAEYIGHVDAVGAQPLLGINADSGHVYSNRLAEAVTEATNFVAFALTNGYATRYWFIGNESYHGSSRSPHDDGISTNGEEAMMTVTEYANYVNLYANAMRAVDPEIKIVANWNNSWSGQYPTLLNLAGTNIDMLDIHTYWNWGQATWSNWVGELPMQSGSTSYAGKIRQFRTNLDSLGYTNTQIGFLEYNLGPWSTNTADLAGLPSRYQTGLMNGEILLQSVEGGLDAGCFWPMNPAPGDGSFRSLFDTNAAHTPLPTFYPLKWFGAVAGHHSVRSTNNFSSGTYTTAALNPTENVLTTFILRKADTGALIEMDSHGFGAQSVQVETFQAPGGNITNDVSEIVSPPYTNVVGGKIQFTVPAWSLTRVTLTKPACHIECGTVTTNGVNSSTWRSVTFAAAFQRPPVVLCSPLTASNAEPALVRVRNVTATGFEYRIAEWDYQDNVHVAETFQWFAVPEGAHDLNGQKWEAGFIESDHQWFKADRFKHKFSSTPYLFYQVYQTDNATVAPRIKNPQPDRFELRLVESKTNDVTHSREKVAYLAVPWNTAGILPDGRKYVVLSTGNSVGTNWTQKTFNTTLTNPCFLAAMQGTIEDDYGCTLRYTNLTSTSVKLKVDEENSTGTNTLAHAAENVAVLVIANSTGIHSSGVLPASQNTLATNGTITLQFDAPLAVDSATNFTVWSKGYPGLYIGVNCRQIPGVWTISNNITASTYQAIFTPTAPFTPGDLVVARIAPELASASGSLLSTETIFSFLVDDGNRFGAAETYINPYKLEYAGTHNVPIWICAPTNGSGPFPVMFWVHGGGWSGGTATQSAQSKVDPYLCEHLGVVLVGVSYRCLGSGGVFSEGLQDVLDAVAYIRTNAATYNADTNRIGLFGGSAGTPLSSLAAQQLPEAKCFIGYNGIYNFVTNPGSGFPGSTSYQQNIPSLATNSAIYNLRSNPPAVLLLHGTADTTISNSQSVLFGAAVAAQHSYAKVCLYQDEAHAFFNPPPLDLITLYEVKEHVRKFLLTTTQTNVWIGGQSSNSWDYMAANWLNYGDPSAFSDDSIVLFDNTGATNSTVNLTTTVLPAGVTVNSSSNYTIGGAGGIGGAGTLSKSGAGTLTLSGNNTYAGGTTNGGTGTLLLGNNNVLGNGLLTLNNLNSTICSDSGTTRTLTNALFLDSGHNFGGNSPTNGQLTFSGPVNLGNVNRSLTIRSAVTFSGNITPGGDNGTFTKQGSAKLTLTGTNTCTARTSIGNGTLALVAGAGVNTLLPNTAYIYLSSASSLFDVSQMPSGFAVLSGQSLAATLGSVTGNVTVATGGKLEPGLNAANLTYSATNTFTFRNNLTLQGEHVSPINSTNSPNASKTAVTSALNLGGTLTVTNLGPALTGGEVFTLFSAASFSGAFTTTNLPPLATNLNWWLGNLPTNGTVVVNRAPTATNATYFCAKGASLKIPIATLLTNYTGDADGDAVALQAVGGGSQGATITTNATDIIYTPSTGATSNANDSFTYTVRDGRGGNRTANISVIVLPAASGLGIGVADGSNFLVSLTGLPGYNYVLQRSSNLIQWANVATNALPFNASNTGPIGFTNSPPHNPAFYRTTLP